MKLKEKFAMEYCEPKRGHQDQYSGIILDAYKAGFEKAREMAFDISLFEDVKTLGEEEV